MPADAAPKRVPVWCLTALLFLLPFEPRKPVIHLPGMDLTLLEVAASLALAALLAAGRAGLPALLRRPPPPIALIFGFAAAHLLSAALAPSYRGLALKFALRMTAAAVFALAVALAPRAAHRRALSALALASSVVALLAVLEAAGVRAVDPLLALFREAPNVVGGVRRATAGSESPNLAAAFLMFGLVAGVGLLSERRDRLSLAFAALLSVGLLGTYSRGVLAASVVALVVLARALGSGGRSWHRAPLAALALLIALSAAFAAATSPFRLRWMDAGFASWYGARYEPEDSSLGLTPGEIRPVSVRVTNTGREGWAGDSSFMLAYHWYEPEDRRNVADDFGTPLRRPLAAGDSVKVTVRVRAPAQEGRYVLIWDMLHTHVGWFSGRGVAPARVPAVVSTRKDRPPPPADVSTAPGAPEEWRPGRDELWRLALAMWRDHPLTGVGPDNFRWLQGPYARRSAWDYRTFANNAFLEVAATTGALGLLSFIGTLLATLRGAFRRRATAVPGSRERLVAAILLALATAFVVHGAIDYVLAFTGHYLLLGLVVGAVSARAADAPDETRVGQ